MRRPSAFEVRARELAVAAGLDPDSRVLRPGEEGSRGMPAWCGFRDAAKAERIAAVELPPQDAAYADAPLKVFGAHDESTLGQMRNCMGVGRVVAGVVCADGHLGYAQPVGGVIAYERQLSISGVGFDIGCVDAETEFLSPSGWIRMDCWSDQFVAQYDPDTGKAGFVTPARYVEKPAATWLRLKSKYGVDQMLSPDHRMLVYAPGPDRAFAKWSVQAAEEFSAKHASTVQGHDYRINTVFEIERDSMVDLTDEELAVVVMTCADACLDERERQDGSLNGAAQLILEKERKVDRARALLIAAGIPFTEKGPNERGHTCFRYRPPLFTKSLSHLWAASPGQLRIIAAEAVLWDGSAETRAFYSRDKASADFIHYAFAATGVRSVMRQDTREDGGIDYRVFAQPNTKVGVKSVPKTPIEKIVAAAGEKQYCFTVPTGFFVTRRSGQIALTGNCGNMAVRLDTPYEAIKDRASSILADVRRVISFGVGRTNAERAEHALLDDDAAWDASGMGDYRHKAATQLGTVGSGNHYVDLLADEAGMVWIGVHFGSRGLGHTSATRYLKAAGGRDGMHVPPAVVDEDSELGLRYIAAMELAGRYAYAGREWVVERVRRIIGGAVADSVHNHHNYAWRETHGGRELWVTRKGATPAWPGQRGFVGGSMGDDAVIVEGVESKASRAALYSTVHGAGRLFSRTTAKRTFTQAQMDAWLQERGVLLAGGDLDESPMAYRRLPEVLAQHAGTIRVLHTLRPFAVAMAGKGEFDPFKD